MKLSYNELEHKKEIEKLNNFYKQNNSDLSDKLENLEKCNTELLTSHKISANFFEYIKSKLVIKDFDQNSNSEVFEKFKSRVTKVVN
jgi:hypothetical protein